MRIFNLKGSEPDTLGLQDGRLIDGPADRPNWVSSYTNLDFNLVEPLEVSGSLDSASSAIKAVVGNIGGTRLVEESPSYQRWECTSRVFGFVDDLEIVIDAANMKIHVKSASRLGYSDLGANRRRVEMIRSIWDAR